MRIAVTGPTGAIGMALLEECAKNQVEALAICHRHSKRTGRLPISEFVKILELDLSEYGTYVPDAPLGKYDVFYHFAWNGTIGDARNDVRVQHGNIGHALDAVLLAQRLGCRTFVGAGSQAEYGRVDGTLSPSTPAFPENGYGIAKLCAGQMSRILCGQLGMRHVWARILSVYGPGDGDKTMIMSAIRQLLRGEAPKFTKAEQQWDYLYSKDAAKAMLLLGEKGKNGKVYCLGSGKTRMLKEYIDCLRDAVDAHGKLEIGAIPYAEKQVMHLRADISELQGDTGFVPTVDFEAGIRETVDWVRAGGIKR